MNISKDIKDNNIWSADCQSFNLFSMLLERQVLTGEVIDLSFTPIEYLQQITSCDHTDEGEGYLNLLVMLFSEYFQKNVTGEKHINLPVDKYNVMAKQFLFYSRLEIQRREGVLSNLKIEYLFNPNVKTEVSFVSKEFDVELAQRAELLNIRLVIS